MQLPTTPRRICTALLLIAAMQAADAQGGEYLSAEQRQQDVAALCRFVADEYAYFDRKATDWPQACATHAAQARQASDRAAFVGALEGLLGDLYDAHAHLATHQARSPRLVPSQAFLVARWVGGEAVVTALRADGPAAAAGVRVGDRISAAQGVAVSEAAAALEPSHLTRPDPAARHWALQLAIAGRHDQDPVQLDLQGKDATQGTRRVRFSPNVPAPAAALSATMYGSVAHVRPHNSLGQDALVTEFDHALDQGLSGARALVLDLRDTPSGGNSHVARGLMGRLLTRVREYQRHERVAEARVDGVRRSWVEEVSPRGRPFTGAVVVLVGPWTGSMGEGLAIGLHAARGAPVVGQPMAGLLGALGEVKLPHSGITVRVPVEKLSHVDGTPREAFVPRPLKLADAAGDAELKAALALAGRL